MLIKEIKSKIQIINYIFNLKMKKKKTMKILRENPFSIEEGQSLSRSRIRVLGLKLRDKLHNLRSCLARCFQSTIGPIKRIYQSLLQPLCLDYLYRLLLLRDRHAGSLHVSSLVGVAAAPLVVAGLGSQRRPPRDLKSGISGVSDGIDGKFNQTGKRNWGFRSAIRGERRRIAEKFVEVRVRRERGHC